MEVLFNRIVSFLGITSLKGRLRFWFLCFLVVLGFCASIPFIVLGKQQGVDSANETIEKMTNLQQVVIDNWIDERMAVIQSIAQLPAVTAMDLPAMEKTFQVIDEQRTEFSGIFYVNKEGISVIDTTGRKGLNVSDREYFREAQKGNAHITDVLIGRQSNRPIVIFSVPIQDERNHFQGLIFGTVTMDTINGVMKQFQDDASESYLVNRDGMLLTESRQGEIGEKIDTEIYRKALKGNEFNEIYKTQSGLEVLGDYRWVHNQKWLVIGEIAKSQVYQHYYNLATTFTFVFIILLAAGYFVIIWVSNQIEAPLRKVLEGTRRIGGGNWHYRLSPLTFRRDAMEFQELSNKFNGMAEIIEKHIDSIKKSENRFRMIADYSSDMITIHDSKGTYLYVSPAGRDILQYEESEIIGFDSEYFIHPDDRETTREHLQLLLEVGYVVTTYRIRRKNGDYIWFESSCKFFETENETEPQIIVISRNITERKQAEEKLQEANRRLKELSSKDGLTGVWNRRTFDERLKAEWNRALSSNAPLSLIMFDIDFFKAFNDTYGHQVGDDCLREIATEVGNMIHRSGDMVFRYGGEEFSVILPDTGIEDAIIVAERIRKAVEDLNIPHSGSQIGDVVTMSFGTNTLIPSDDKKIDEFLADADKALYRAKQEGRNCVRTC